MINRTIIFWILFFLLSVPINAQEIDSVHSNKFKFSPSIAGGQIELTTLLIVTEYGALVDFDLFKIKSSIEHSFGTRISFENYSYTGPDDNSKEEGTSEDYCFYVMHSGRSDYIHFNIFLGLAYFTEVPTYNSANILFRAGFEFRFNPGTKIFGFIFKGASSFDTNTTYFGFGFAVGYYK